MSPKLRLLLLLGCVLVGAVESPLCARVVSQDWLGPYARPAQAVQSGVLARVDLDPEPADDPDLADDDAPRGAGR
jgi:hypothetical protein